MSRCWLVLVYFIGNPTGGMPHYRESRVQRAYSDYQKVGAFFRFDLTIERPEFNWLN